MSASRPTDSHAPLVCSVLNTRCPVRAACTATLAVSASRISPTISTSGSCRSKLRSTFGNVRPIFSFTWNWLTRSIWYSTGSSTVQRFRSTPRSTLRAAYNVVLLPDPVGPVTRTMPFGLASSRRSGVSTSPLKPSLSRSSETPRWSSTRTTTLSPCVPGSVETRRSIVRPSVRTWMRPSCGSRRSAMSRSAMIFTRLATAGPTCAGSGFFATSTPSTRNRTRSWPSEGSMWRSLAPSRTAW